MCSLVPQGKLIIFITHKLREVMAVAYRINVLRLGKVVGTADPKTATQTELASLMVGRSVELKVNRTPAKPGETIVVYGTGFGATQPSISATAPVPSPLALANLQDLRVRIGGVDAAVAFAGLISPGLYQFNVVVPLLNDGDQTIVAELRGLLTRSDLLLAVQH
jgi:uncharacterized protein (TIGR03437 family)